MRIRRITIEGFGCLSGEFDFAADGCDLIVENNEQGKTTLASAIVAALYGVRKRDRRGRTALDELDQYRPWSEEPYRVTIDIEAQDGPRRIVRDLEEGTVEVWDTAADAEITEQFHEGKGYYAVGERLLGLTRESFLKTALSPQQAIAWDESPTALTEGLQAIADSEAGEVTASRAIAALDEAVRSYAGATTGKTNIMISTEVTRLEDQIGKLQRNLADVRQLRESVEEKAQHLTDSARRESELAQDIQRCELMCAKAELRDISRALDGDDEIAARLETAQEEAQSLTAFAEFPSEKSQALSDEVARLSERSIFIREQNTKLQEEVDDRLAEIEEQLERDRHLAQMSSDDLGVLEAVERDLRRVAEEADDLEQRCDHEWEALAARGISIDEFDALDEKFAVFAPDAVDALRGWEKTELDFKNRDGEIERSEREAEGLAAEASGIAKRRRTKAAVLAAIGLGVCLIGMATPFKVAVLIIGVMTFAFAAYLSGAQGKAEKEKLAESERLRAGAEARRTALGDERTRWTDRLRDMAEQGGFGDGAGVVAAFDKWGKSRAETEKYRGMMRRLSELRDTQSRVRQDACPVLRKAGETHEANDVTVADVSRVAGRVKDYLTTLGRQDALRKRRRTDQHDIEEADRRRNDCRDAIHAILRQADIDTDLPLDDAIAAFTETKQKHDRHNELCRSVIPQLERQRLSATERESRQERVQELGERIEGLETSVTDAPGPDEPLSAYTRQRDELGRERERVMRQRAELDKEIGQILDECESREPALAQELDEKEAALRRATQYEAAIGLARDVMADVAQETNKQWTASLAEAANRVLEGMGSGYGEAELTDALELSVRDVGRDAKLDNTTIDDHLSAGAKDQIYLAARLALSHYFSKDGDPLPLILDEPFANTDDERFERAMRFLAESLSKDHQVIILTCHRQRHEWLRGNDIEWFDDHFHLGRLTGE